MSENDGKTAARGTDPPRALSYEDYSFNFKVDLAARVAAQAGAPAFAQRRARLNEALQNFWEGVERRYEELSLAAEQGRIGEDGREVRLSLLSADGADPLGTRDHKKRLFSKKEDPQERARVDFNRAWERYLAGCGMETLAAQVGEFIKYFPIESSMPLDPETDAYMWMGEPWRPPVAPTRDEVLARFPLR